MAIILFFLALPIILLFVLLKMKPSTKYKLPPGPKGLPIIGNLHQLYFTIPHKYFWQLSKKYGPIMTIRYGTRPAIIVTSAKLAKEIMKTYDLIFCTRPNLLGIDKISYHGSDLAFAPYSEYWRELRRLGAIHLFSSNRSASFRPIREAEVRLMCKKVSQSIADGKPFDISQGTIDVSNRVALMAAAGKVYGFGDRLFWILRETQSMFTACFLSDYIPYIGKFLDWTSGLSSRLHNLFCEYDSLFEDIIDEQLQGKGAKSSDYENLVEILIKLYKEQTSKVQLTINHIKGILMNVFVGGTETSAATVVWAMCLLMKNGDKMRKTQEEIRSVAGKKGFVVEEDIQKCPYFKGAVREAMRLEPSVPMLVPREAMEDCKLEGYDIPAKTIVHVNNWAIGRDPEAWDKPLEFRPERFLDSKIDVKGYDYELIPFGAGRRQCPGYHMGIANVELQLSNLLYRFDWEMPTGMTPDDIDLDDCAPGLAVHKKQPLMLMARDYLQ